MLINIPRKAKNTNKITDKKKEILLHLQRPFEVKSWVTREASCPGL